MKRPTTEQMRSAAKGAAARALNTAKTRAGKNYDELSTQLGVGPQRVARLCSDDDSKSTKHLNVVPNLADAILVDEQIFDELLAEIFAARLALHGPRTTRTLEQLALRVVECQSEETRLIASAVGNDGKITGPEGPTLLAARAKTRAASDEYETDLKRRCP